MANKQFHVRHGLQVSGNAEASGNLSVKGSTYLSGQVQAKGNLSVTQQLKAGGSVSVAGGVIAKQGLQISANASVGGNIYAGQQLRAGGSVSVADEDALPQAFQLFGNYPNPFNPTTNVSFALRENAMVTVDVFDMLGRHLLQTPSQMLLSGQEHKIQVDASSLTSGTYLYRVTAVMPASVEVQSGQMTLLK